MLTVVRRVTVAEAATEKILELLRRSRLRKGDVLPPEKELMVRLGVGRSTVREALQRLAVLGLVEGRPGRGWIVKAEPGFGLNIQALIAAYRQESADELFELRLILDAEIAALAAVRATRADLDRMRGILEKTRRVLERKQDAFKYSLAFHEVLAEAAHNGALLRVYRDVARRIREVSSSSEMSTVEARHFRLDEHLAIFNAVTSRDPEAARRAMRRHLEGAHDWLRHALSRDLPSMNTGRGREQSAIHVSQEEGTSVHVQQR